jgi:hypothetical protein
MHYSIWNSVEPVLNTLIFSDKSVRMGQFHTEYFIVKPSFQLRRALAEDDGGKE